MGSKKENRGEEGRGRGMRERSQLHVFSGPLLPDGTFRAALRHGLPASPGLLETRCRFLHGRRWNEPVIARWLVPPVVARVSGRLVECSGVLTAICSVPPHGKLFNATSQERLAATLFFALSLCLPAAGFVTSVYI